MPNLNYDLALVLSGGGARAAYQVGFLKYLARRFPNLRVPILTGVSAGAINAIHLASYRGSFADSVAELVELWRKLKIEDVFRADASALGRNLLRWGFKLVSGGLPGAPTVRGFVDTQPLREFLNGRLNPTNGTIPGVEENLHDGRLKAVAIITTNYATGQTVTFVQGKEIEAWERPNRRSVHTNITVDHVMASASLPLFFPAVRIDNSYYGDGGVRQAAPLSPAIHLGANRLLAISTRYRRSFVEADLPSTNGYPPPAQILSILMNAVFLDVLDQDALMLERVNYLIEKLPAEDRLGLRPVKLFMLRPSLDIGKMSGNFEPELPRSFRFLTRGLGTRETKSPDSLSMLLFEPNYLEALMDIGEKDAESRADELDVFLG